MEMKKHENPEITEIRVDRDISLIMMSPPGNPGGPGVFPYPNWIP